MLSRQSTVVAKSDEARATLAALPLTVALGLAAIAIVLVLPLLSAMPSASQAFLVCLNICLCLLGMLAGSIFGARPVLIMYFGFNLCWLAIPAAFQLGTGTAAWGDSIILTAQLQVTLALILNALSGASLLIGYFVRVRRSASRVRTIGAVWTGGVRGYFCFTTLLVVAGLALLPLAASALGGFPALFATRSEVAQRLAESGLSVSDGGGGMVALVRTVPAALAATTTLLLVNMLTSRSKYGLKIASTQYASLLLVVSVGLLWCYANPFANTRFVTLVSFGPAVLLLLRPLRARAGVALGCAVCFLFLAVYPLSRVFQSETISFSGYAEAFAGQDFDGFQQVINVFPYVENNGHSFGIYALSAALFFVPRSLWEGKATPASIDVATERGYSFTNLSLPVHAEFYIDFSWIGVVIVFLLLGRMYSRLDESWIGQSKWAPLSALIAMVQIGLIRGPLGSQVPVVGLTVTLCFVAILLLGSREGIASNNNGVGAEFR